MRPLFTREAIYMKDMGFPLGWTESGALEMHRFRQWCASHGAFFAAE